MTSSSTSHVSGQGLAGELEVGLGKAWACGRRGDASGAKNSVGRFALLVSKSEAERFSGGSRKTQKLHDCTSGDVVNCLVLLTLSASSRPVWGTCGDGSESPLHLQAGQEHRTHSRYY